MQQTTARSFLVSFRAAALLSVLSSALVGCQKEESKSYSVPKETAGNPSPAPSSEAPMPMPGTAPSAGAGIHWSVPNGWTEKPAGGMRVGSFAVSKDGKQADVSIIPLGAGAGGELANVNRWRHDQLGLPPIEEGQLAGAGEKVSIGPMTGTLYDLAGTDPKSQQPTRILASMLPMGESTWFFKMTGNAELVEQEKPAFKELLKSIQFGSAAASDSVGQAHQGLDMSSSGLPASALAAPSSAEKPAWTVPEGWQEQAPSAMRLATFSVGGAGNAKADVSVTKLAGMAGGLLPNVNRWRSQVGLAPVDASGMEKLLTTREINGIKVMMVELAGSSVESGQPSRLLVAVVPRGEATWFFKMFGDDQLVAQQKAAFTKFVESVRYPNVS